MRYGPLGSGYDLLFNRKDMMLGMFNERLLRLFIEEDYFTDYYAGSFLGALIILISSFCLFVVFIDLPCSNFIDVSLTLLLQLVIVTPLTIIWKRKSYNCCNEPDVDFRRDTGQVIFYYSPGRVDTVNFENLTAYYEIFHRTKNTMHGAGHLLLTGKSVDGKLIKHYIKTDIIDGFGQAICFWDFVCKYMDKEHVIPFSMVSFSTLVLSELIKNNDFSFDCFFNNIKNLYRKYLKIVKQKSISEPYAEMIRQDLNNAYGVLREVEEERYAELVLEGLVKYRGREFSDVMLDMRKKYSNLYQKYILVRKTPDKTVSNFS